ncbi:MAG: methyltransferase domain-containing protein [Deltaproteobacteria bacterium]|nr:methyltransferase domain-containing protein [Deltaproteobacteria bacterium]
MNSFEQAKSINKKKTIRQQFDLQADKFSNWSVTRNLEYMQQYAEFCGLIEKDTLLDVACGTGEYAIYCAQKINKVCGVDLSNKMIEVAQKNANALQLENLSFQVQDVLKLPFESNQFSIVNCKSAFHHFDDYEMNICEMKRCCKTGGRISVQDIIAYENPKINNYFESLESLIDISHNKTLSAYYITQLFHNNNIEILRSRVVNVELDLKEYIHHAVQTEAMKNEIFNCVDFGINDSEIANYFIEKEEGWYFKRNVLLVLGKKP